MPDTFSHSLTPVWAESCKDLFVMVPFIQVLGQQRLLLRALMEGRLNEKAFESTVVRNVGLFLEDNCMH